MEIKLGDIFIDLPGLYNLIIVAIMVFLLFRWSQQLEKRKITILFYFLISTSNFAIYSQSTTTGVFELWLPLGFIAVFLYLFRSEKYHPAKLKASLLGLSVAICQLVVLYTG